MVVINTTRQYHKTSSIDLMKEFTICESFACLDSPYMIALKEPEPYGALIGKLLIAANILKPGTKILEAGGGYGSLMKGLLGTYLSLIKHAYMIDISKALLNIQRKNLSPWKKFTTFINADITEIIHAISSMDLIILNEMLGDLDTWTGLEAKNLPDDAARMVNNYHLDIPKEGTFNLNMGALSLIEETCRKGIPVFISEHSCDPIIPEDMAFLEKDLELNSFPREIKLYGHSEFTIRFSHLIQVAKAWHRNILTGPVLKLVGLKDSPQMRFIFTMHACATEKQEIIFEILDHIREYRWLVIY
ncbi:MAG: class I SAM-dependent methyltransferase [Thermodesulfobacteriota bacterium]|nr:class I SAM-dependent methyltransferase [Thermodesulfobacteriota bacterium]